jgi:hypothetical protein
MMIVVPQVVNSMNITPAFQITGGSLTHSFLAVGVVWCFHCLIASFV